MPASRKRSTSPKRGGAGRPARRIIDIHNHANWHGHDVDALVRNMDELGIETTWLLSWEIPPREFDMAPVYHGVMDPRGTAAPLAGVLEGLHRYPDRFVGGWAPDPRDPHARAKLRAAVEIHGIRVCGELKCRMRYDSPDALALFATCGRLGLPVIFHLQFYEHGLAVQCADETTWPEWYGGGMDAVETMLRRCPDTTFIGHATAFWRAISGDADQDTESYPKRRVKPGGRLPALLRKYPNLYADLSASSGRNALDRDHAHARKFLREFQGRLLFGRDDFHGELLTLLEKLDPGERVLRKVLHENAERLLREGEARRG